LDWIGLDWIGLDWIGPRFQTGVEKTGFSVSFALVTSWWFVIARLEASLITRAIANPPQFQYSFGTILGCTFISVPAS